MARLDVDIETKLPPDRVIAALTDFSEQRPDIWSGLSRKFYEVYSVGDHTASVREGSDKPIPVWAREHYEWTDDRVSWTVEESNFCKPGGGVSVTVHPAEAGGSKLHLTWNRSPSNFKGAMAVMMMKLIGRKLLHGYLTKSLNDLAEKQ